jgi:transcriptional regulator with XRE-family HTH domain
MAYSKRVTQREQRALDAGDAAIGPRIRTARRRQEMSQTALAKKLGITFQQIQKYEQGTNRVSIGRLANIADILGISVTFLLTGSEKKRGQQGVDEGGELLKTTGALRLIKAYNRIKNSHARAALVALAESVTRKRRN